jgi:hypothetical protein
MCRTTPLQHFTSQHSYRSGTLRHLLLVALACRLCSGIYLYCLLLLKMLQRHTMLLFSVLSIVLSCCGAQQLPPRAGSVLWNGTSGGYTFTSSVFAGSAAAWGSVQDTRASNGWATLTIESNSALPVAVQASNQARLT